MDNNLVSDLKERKGIISINVAFIENSSFKVISEFFRNFIPMRIDNDNLWLNGIITYYGLSPSFDIVEKGYAIPIYSVVIEEALGKPPKVTFDKY